ncbi:MAG TPA: hypothetical protein VEK34_16400 [Methylocella sp.]|nr:hypothetical protein [Methylocella sp.]
MEVAPPAARGNQAHFAGRDARHIQAFAESKGASELMIPAEVMIADALPRDILHNARQFHTHQRKMTIVAKNANLVSSDAIGHTIGRMAEGITCPAIVRVATSRIR